MPKIVFIANQYYPNVVGGAELTTQTLAEELKSRDMDVVVISLSPTSTDSRDDVNGITVYRVAIQNVYTPFGGPRPTIQRLFWHINDINNEAMGAKVARILRAERPDFVSTHNITGFSVSVWRRIKDLGIPLIHTLHDYYLICPRTTMFAKGRNCPSPCGTCRLMSLHKQRASKYVDLVIGVSKFVLEAHTARGYFPNAGKRVIFNSRPWLPDDQPPVVHRADSPLEIGFIGRIEKTKGVEVLLEAVKRLPNQSWSLAMAGRAPDPKYLAMLQSRYPMPEVVYKGFMRPADFYPDVEVVVVPSLWNEPLPTVVFEALGFGVPVIVSRLGGLPELVEGTNAGWIVPAGDVGALSTLLGQLQQSRSLLSSMRASCLARRADFLPQRQGDDFIDAISIFMKG